jgi:galactosamine-6-phosphate isomerase
LGLPEGDPATCEYFLQREIIRPLGVSPDRYIAFDPLCVDARTECRRVEQAVRACGVIDAMVLGVGRNGHLGLNEPGSELCCAAHPAILASRTRDHPMLRSTRSPVTHGMTLGLDSIFGADQILLLITGEGKGRVLDYLRKGSVSAEIPASMLHLHRNVSCLADMTIRE